MNTYIAYLFTDSEHASAVIEASNTQEALEKAKAKADLPDADGLIFENFYERQPVTFIEILDEDRNELAEWRHPDLLLRIAAPELRDVLQEQTDAAQTVIDNWSGGDLAAAVNGLEGLIEPARAIIAKTKPATA